jgi:hypothetical protein
MKNFSHLKNIINKTIEENIDFSQITREKIITFLKQNGAKNSQIIQS